MGLFDKFKKDKKSDNESLDLFDKVASNDFTPQNLGQSETMPQSSNFQINMQQDQFFGAPQAIEQYSAMQQTPANYQQENYSQHSEGYSSYDWESYIQAIAEKVFDDKSRDILEKIEELRIWKEKIELEMEKVKDNIEKLSKKVDDLNMLLVRKIEDYDKGIKEATTEVQALHKLVRTMVPAISESVKELRETIEEIKLMREKLRTP